MSYVFTARYSSDCDAECGRRIEPGDDVIGDRDESGDPVFRHAHCPTISKPTKFEGTSLEQMGY